MTIPNDLLKSIQTKRAVYAVTFSNDGHLVAYGGGHSYGDGYLAFLEILPEAVRRSPDLLAPLVPRIVEEILESPFEDPPPSRDMRGTWEKNLSAFAVSGLCFDGSNNYLAVSLWQFRHYYFPSLLVRFADRQLFFEGLYTEDRNWLARATVDRRIATGIRMWDGRLIVRRGLDGDPDNTFYAFSLPEEIDGSALPHHLTSSRVACLNGAFATGGSETGHLLITKDTQLGAMEARSVPSHSESRITTISTDANGKSIVTGTADGSMDFWEYDDSRDPTHVATRTGHEAAVTAACALSTPGIFASADKSGNVRVWRDREKLLSWKLPEGSPRSMAAHPTKPLLVVGCKGFQSGDSGHPNEQLGFLYVYELHL